MLAVVVNMLWPRERPSAVLLPPLTRERGVSDICGAAPKNGAFPKEKAVPALGTARAVGLRVFLFHKNVWARAMRSYSL